MVKYVNCMVFYDPTKGNRISSFLIFFGFSWSLFNRIFLTVTRRFDPDEFEHLHAGWMIASGFVPYRDFWQNHTPLFYYLLAPAIQIFGEGIPLIFIVRSILSVIGLFILWITYRFALLYTDRLTAILSTLVLSCSYLFLHKTIEIRPDHFLVVCWLGSLYLARLSSNRNGLPIFLAGVLLGIGLLFSPKALLCLAAIYLHFACRWIIVDRMKEILQAFKHWTLYALGFLVPVGISAAILYYLGMLELVMQSTVLGNLNFPEGRKLAYLLSLRYIVLFLLCAAGIVISFRDRKLSAAHRDVLLMAVPTIFLAVIFIFVMPTSNPQSALIFVPFTAIFAGVAFKKACDSFFQSDAKRLLKPRLIFILVILAAIVVPSVAALYEKSSTPDNKKQLELIRAVLSKTGEQDLFFDGNSAYIFRRQCYHYGSLIEAVRKKIEKNEIKVSIVDSLKNNQCKFVIYDDRVSLLSDDVQRFIQYNYVPSDIPDVLIAGVDLGPQNFSDRKATFWIEIPMFYSFNVQKSSNFKIDGKSYEHPVFLEAGSHRIVSDTRLHSVQIRAATDPSGE